MLAAMRRQAPLAYAVMICLAACDGGAADEPAKPAPEAPAAPATPEDSKADAPTPEADPEQPADEPAAPDTMPANDAPATGCFASVATIGQQRCTLDSDCAVFTAACSNCWGTANASSESAIVAALQARDANKKCAKPQLPKQPKAMCKAGLCSLLDPGEVVGCCSSCEPSGCDDCSSVSSAETCEGVRTSCTKLKSPRGDVLACSTPGEDDWGGLGLEDRDYGVGGLNLGKQGTATGADSASAEGLQLTHAPASIKGELGEDEVRAVVEAQRAQVEACYAKAEAKARVGKVSINFAVTNDGSVGSSVVKASTMPGREVAQCLARAIKSWAFPPISGIALVDYEFVSSGAAG